MKQLEFGLETNQPVNYTEGHEVWISKSINDFKRRNTMTLANELSAFKEQFLGQADPKIVTAFESAAADLEAEFQRRELLSVGDRAPDFTLPAANGESVSLSERLKEGPVIISFYRGSWCPYCNLELRAYQELLPEIEGAGGSLVAISPQTPDNSLSMAEKNELEFDVLSDVGSKVSESFGVAFKLPQELIDIYTELGGKLPEFNGTDDWTLPVPGTFVVAPDGTIALAYVDTDYQKRLEPSEALAVLRSVKN